jgi:serine/threonine-protein kinase
VIHRDLKPSNIMLGDFGEVYVLDWGVSRIIGETDEVARSSESAAPLAPDSAEATEAGAILGTPGYIAPEMIRGEAIDPRADVYALGAILFEILTGESLLPRGRAALIAALDPFNTRPSTRAPDREIAPELDEICVAATSTLRDDRPTARGLADRIERYLDGDRDLALRKTLAASHLDAARAALAAGDDTVRRATAMREAGRAIALDPKSAAAAELVGRLMLEPPREVPAEVEEHVNTIEGQVAHSKVRMMVWAMCAFLSVIPAVLVIGVRHTLALVIFTLVVVINIALTAHFARRDRVPSRRTTLASVIAFSVVVVVMSRVFTPFLLAPSVTAIAVLLFVADPRTPWRFVTALLTTAAIAPWLLELAGLVPRTIRAVDGDLVMHLDIAYVHFPASEVAIALYVIISIALCGILASQLGLRQRETLRAVELQAWHLRQLVKG